MLSWLQGLIADGIGFVLILVMLVGSVIIGVVFGRGSTWLSWLYGIAAFVCFGILLGPIISALDGIG